MRKLLIVVDMQNDFVTGALRNEEAIRIVPNVVSKIERELAEGTELIFTRDTHGEDYMETEEGRNLPVPHCLYGSEGWEIIDELKKYAESSRVLDKITFGSRDLGRLVSDMDREQAIDQVELIGICTDICVISNALLVKAFLPNVPISVDPSCCAGVTPESHDTALAAMRACHIRID